MNFNKSIIGMVHIQALPGTPGNQLLMNRIVSKALHDAEALEKGGVDSIMIENMHDRPYINRKVGPEITAAMTSVAVALRQQSSLPLGIQILAGANREALAVALAAELDYIRAEGFVFGHLADEGWMNSDAGNLLRFRKNIGAEHIKIITDIKKKHSSHSISADVSIAETAGAAEFFLSDGVVVTGKATGEKANVDEVKEIKNSTRLPVIIGSGVDQLNIEEFWPFADAFIVGSWFKKNGEWQNDVELTRVKNFMNKINQLKK